MKATSQALYLIRVGSGSGSGGGILATDESFDEETVALEGLEGLLSARVRTQKIPGAWRRQHAETAAMTIVSLQELARALDKLREQGLDVVLLPGAALLRFYPDAGCRPMDDVDLLCSPGQVGLVAGALIEMGWTSVARHPDLLNGRHVHVDLHDDLFHCQRIAARRRVGWIAPDELSSRRRAIVVEGLHFWGLSPEDEVLYTAAHALRHRYRRVTWLTDLALQLWDDELHIDSLRQRSVASNLQQPVFFAMSLLQAANVQLPKTVRAWYRQGEPGRIVRWLLHGVLAARHTTAVGEILWYWTSPSWRDRRRSLSEFLFPRSDILLQVFPGLAPVAYPLRCIQLATRLVCEVAAMMLAPVSRRVRRG